VTVATVEPRNVPVTDDYVGVTKASRVVEIRARVQGFIETRDFEEGSLVKKGQKLFTIDPRSFNADQQIALAQVEQAQSRLNLAEQDVRRLRSVKEPGAVAASDIDQKVAEQANAAAMVRLAKAQLAKAELELGYTTVEAPLTGLVGKAEKEIGSLVDSAQNSLLTTIQQVDPIYVSFKVTETDYLEIRRQVESGALVLASDTKQPYIEITLLDGSTYPERGFVDFEDVSVDVPTGTVELRGTFKNPDRVLKPGQFVKVHAKGYERPNTLTVPQRAVSQSPQGSFVYVIGADNKAEMRPVKLQQWVNKDWIVQEGLKAGERIVVEGLTKVQPGITVVPVAEAPAQQAPQGQPAQPGQPQAKPAAQTADAK
jgi:membrane fusion protein (multidrug efflux system)